MQSALFRHDKKKILDKIPFDYVDSSSWVQEAIFGKITGVGKVSREMSKTNRDLVIVENYKRYMQIQDKYEQKWRKEKKQTK